MANLGLAFSILGALIPVGFLWTDSPVGFEHAVIRGWIVTGVTLSILVAAIGLGWSARRLARGKASMIAATLSLLIAGAGIIAGLQRPIQFDTPIIVRSPDGSMSGMGMTLHSMRVFDSDRVTYRLLVEGANDGETWMSEVPLEQEGGLARPLNDLSFEKRGKIDWSEDGETVSFRVGDTRIAVFDINATRWKTVGLLGDDFPAASVVQPVGGEKELGENLPFQITGPAEGFSQDQVRGWVERRWKTEYPNETFEALEWGEPQSVAPHDWVTIRCKYRYISPWAGNNEEKHVIEERYHTFTKSGDFVRTDKVEGGAINIEESAEQASIARLIISKERGGRITPDGILYSLDGEVVAMEKLQERFQQMVKERPELRVIVSANDPELPGNTAMVAMQLASSAGVKSVRLARLPKEFSDGSEEPNLGTFRISKAYSDEMPGHLKMILRGKSGSETLWVADEVIASREDLMSIMAGETEGILVIQLNEESGKRMQQVTEGMRKGRDRLAIIVDGFPVAAPTVMATLGDRVEIHVPSELSKEVIQRIGAKSGAIGADGSSHDESVTEHPTRAETIDEAPTARLRIKRPDGGEEVGSLREEGIELLREVLSREPDHVVPADRGAPLEPPILLEWEGSKYAVQSDKIVLIGARDWTMWLSPGIDEKLIEHSDVRVIQGTVAIGSSNIRYHSISKIIAGAVGFLLLTVLGFLMHRRINRDRRLEITALFLCVAGVILPLLILIGHLFGIEQAVVALVAFVLFAVMQLAALILGIIRFSEPLGRAAAIASGVLLLGFILFLS